MICEYCGKSVLKNKKIIISHMNVTQNPQKRIFCSIKCKEKWCFHIKKYPKGMMVIWKVIKNKEKWSFFREYIEVEYPPFAGAEIQYSCFAPFNPFN